MPAFSFDRPLISTYSILTCEELPGKLLEYIPRSCAQQLAVSAGIAVAITLLPELL